MKQMNKDSKKLPRKNDPYRDLWRSSIMDEHGPVPSAAEYDKRLMYSQLQTALSGEALNYIFPRLQRDDVDRILDLPSQKNDVDRPAPSQRADIAPPPQRTEINLPSLSLEIITPKKHAVKERKPSRGNILWTKIIGRGGTLEKSFDKSVAGTLEKSFDNTVGNLFDGMDAEQVSEEEFNRNVERELSLREARISQILADMRKLQEKYGLSIADIEQILNYKVELSRIRISSLGDISLSDYGKEVKMDTLSKSVYILFLRHPEGIEFKRMPEYRSEFKAIYGKLTGRSDTAAIEHSLDLLCNPVESNSLNEKVSKIKRAFNATVDPRIAQHYCIQGPAGGIKKVVIPEDLISCEMSLE